MDSATQFQRYEVSYKLLSNDFNTLKDDVTELKREIFDLTEENKKLRRDLKDSLANQLSPSDSDLNASVLRGLNDYDKNIVNNLEHQLNLMRKERDNAMQMWQSSLMIIAQLEQELKNLQFHTAPQTMSFDLELKKRQEEFNRAETAYLKEISILKIESTKKDEDFAQAQLKFNELKLELDNLNSQLNQKNIEKRNLIQKEYGYDDALISLQNDINDLETKNLSIKKDNQYLRESLRDHQNKINEYKKQIIESEHKSSELKSKIEEHIQSLQNLQNENERLKHVEQKHREDNEKLNNAIAELIDEAAEKARKEVESLKKVYNSNLEKLIEECNLIEMDRNNKTNQLEKSLRVKRTLEQELERIEIENQKVVNKGNSTYEDLHKRLCTIERDKDQALIKLEAKDLELKKLQSLYENDKEKNAKMISDYSEKFYKSSRDLEKLSDEHAKLLNEIDELKNKLSLLQAEKDSLQKNLTKQIQIHENEIKVKELDNFNKVKCLEENHSKAMFELRQLLNMQQRMSNKWKEECHSITNQSEIKFSEMKKNFENLKVYNDKLNLELQELRRREVEKERLIESYLNKIKALDGRVKDAELQATEATKRVSKQLAREKMISYEKHLLESDLERTKFNDTFSKGKIFLKNMAINEPPTKQVPLPQLNNNDSSSND